MARGQRAEKRAYVVLFILITAFALLLARIVDLSVLRRDFLKHQGDLRALRVDSVPSPRARIVDRFGVPLAISIPMESIWLDPKLWEGSKRDETHLAAVLHLKVSEVRKKVGQKNRRFTYLKRHANPEVAKKVKALNLKGVYFKKEYRRFYPKGSAIAHVLGITNVDDQGQEGIELAFNDQLTGKPEKRLVEKDRLGRVIAIKKTLSMGKKGVDVQLSIDSQLQEIVYESLLKGVEEAGAASGSVVMLNPATGEVLAMANVPSYNPNRTNRPVAKMRNLAITDLFEPGSTLKPFTVAHLLKSGNTASTLVNVGAGKWLYQGKWIQDEHVEKPWLSLSDVLKYSSNVGVAKLALKTSSRAFLDLLQGFGFGVSTFVGLPGEAAGSFESSIRDHAYSMAALSFGYGMSTTNLQLAHGYAILANEGQDVGVRLHKVARGDVHGHEVISKHTAKAVMHMLERVVSPKGTGYRAHVKGLSIAGKTGTAHRAEKGRYSNKYYTSSFVGILPVSEPKWVVSVVLKDPKRSKRFGAQSAAPIFASIVRQAWWLAAKEEA